MKQKKAKRINSASDKKDKYLEEEELRLFELLQPDSDEESDEIDENVSRRKLFDPLKRLENADSELFQRRYFRDCQKNRQPMVISKQRQKEFMKELKNELKKTNPNTKKAKALQDKLELINPSYNRGYVFRNNYYFCPMAFCYICETVLTMDEVEAHEKKYGHTAIYKIPKKKLKKYKPNLGFLSPDKHKKGLCMPCCYKHKNQMKHFADCFLPDERIEHTINKYIAEGSLGKLQISYNKLCDDLYNNNNLPQLKGMAKALGIKLTKKNKVKLCADIGTHIIIYRSGLAALGMEADI